MTASVEVDWKPVAAKISRMADQVASGAKRAAIEEASATAQRLRAATPRRSGRLADTVDVVTGVDGASVTYGGNLPYARYIAHRTGNVAAAQDDAAQRFPTVCVDLARTEVRRL